MPLIRTAAKEKLSDNLGFQALRNYHDSHFDGLWGPYGPRDSFKTEIVDTQPVTMYSQLYVGIDVGPEVLMIENYRTALVHRLFMSHPSVLAAVKTQFPDTSSVDADAPVSAALSPAGSLEATSFEVQWWGTDQGAGIRDYSVLVSQDGGPYTEWLINTTQTSGVFVGQPEKSYCFYSVARDGAGNREGTPVEPDTCTSTWNGPATDWDRDGCADLEELGSQARLGGQRDYVYFWDFFDVPTGTVLQRDRAVVGLDIAAVVARFGSNDATAGTFNRDSDPLSTPNAAMPPSGARQNYHPAHDRGGSIVGQDAWDLLPPDGSIAAGDIAAVVAQFGHSCAGLP